MKLKVEFYGSARAIQREDGKGFDLKGVHVAAVYQPNADGKWPRKPTIRLVGDDFLDAVDQVRMWAEAGSPNMAEATAISGSPRDGEDLAKP